MVKLNYLYFYYLVHFFYGFGYFCLGSFVLYKAAS